MSDAATLRRKLLMAAAPTLKRWMFRGGFAPGPFTRWAYAGANDLLLISREGYEWLWRSFVATPMFLARCAEHGDDISIDRVPYVVGQCRLVLGSRIRVSGKLGILGCMRSVPTLTIGDGCFIGHDCAFGVARSVTIGNHVSIGTGTYISDTMGHSHRKLGVPIWEDQAEESDIQPVIIDDDVHIGRDCIILRGVRIGARSVIGAGSVVRHSVPADSIVAGNPGRVAGWREERVTPVPPSPSQSLVES